MQRSPKNGNWTQSSPCFVQINVLFVELRVRSNAAPSGIDFLQSPGAPDQLSLTVRFRVVCQSFLWSSGRCPHSRSPPTKWHIFDQSNLTDCRICEIIVLMSSSNEVVDKDCANHLKLMTSLCQTILNVMFTSRFDGPLWSFFFLFVKYSEAAHFTHTHTHAHTHTRTHTHTHTHTHKTTNLWSNLTRTTKVCASHASWAKYFRHGLWRVRIRQDEESTSSGPSIMCTGSSLEKMFARNLQEIWTSIGKFNKQYLG